MSRIGQKPVEIPSGVEVKIEGRKVSVKGPKGELHLEIHQALSARVDGAKVIVTRQDDTRLSKSTHGLTRTMISNMFEGVTKGYLKDLEIQGVGFKAVLQGKKLVLSLGYSHQIDFDVPLGINITVEGGTKVVVAGADKQKVGDTAARIRSYYPAEPYKGKGVRYRGEHVRRKVGKSVA